jgi:hypothetical protein
MLSAEETLIIEFKKGNLSFPWLRERIENPRELFKNIQNYIPEIQEEKPFIYKYIVWKTLNIKHYLKYKNQKYISIITKKDDYETIDKLVDYFNEKPRMSSCRRDKIDSPINIWTKKPHILEPWIQQQKKYKKEITCIGLREQLWKMGYECNAFKATLALSIYKIFKPKRILDFSSGWGDRLLAAMAYKAERYLGYDPNPQLQNGYQEMIQMFSDNANNNYEIITEPFERSEKRNETFDLIFTSPPYFDFETYVSSDKIISITQSIMNYPKLNDWIIHFLFTSLYKCWDYLIIGGNMVIHISDVYKTNFVEVMILFVLGWCKGARMDGSIASIGDCGKPRPLWIFHKTENKKNDVIFVKKMEKYYPEIFSLLISPIP